MADDIRSWISKALISHDQEHGANLQKTRKGSYCQLLKFTSYREDGCPDRQITARISDRTHWVDVFFDVNATDEFEKSHHGLPAESLTSHLRSVFLINSYRIHLSDRPSRPDRSRSLSRTSSHPSRAGSETSVVPEPDIPKVKLEILSWEVVSGDKHDPVFFERTAEVGLCRGDAEVQRVLRKWWTGGCVVTSCSVIRSLCSYIRSFEDPLAGNGHVSHGGPSRLSDISSKPSLADVKPFLRISRDQLLEHILKHPNADRTKALPDWLFEVSAEQRDELDGIVMFGLDPEAEEQTELPGPPMTVDEHVGQSAIASTTSVNSATNGLPRQHIRRSRGPASARRSTDPGPFDTHKIQKLASPAESPANTHDSALQVDDPAFAQPAAVADAEPESIDVFIPPRTTPISQEPSNPRSTITLPQLGQQSPPSRPSERAQTTQAISTLNVELDADGSEPASDAVQPEDMDVEEEDVDMASSNGSEEIFLKRTQAAPRKQRKAFEALFESYTPARDRSISVPAANRPNGRSSSADISALVGREEAEPDEEMEHIEDVDAGSVGRRNVIVGWPNIIGIHQSPSVKSHDWAKNGSEHQHSDADETDLSDYELEQRIKRAQAALDRRRSRSKRISGSAGREHTSRSPVLGSPSPRKEDGATGLQTSSDVAALPGSAAHSAQTQTQTAEMSSVEEAQRPAPGQHVRSSPWPNNRTTSERLRTPSESLSQSLESAEMSLSRYVRPTQAQEEHGDVTLSGETGGSGSKEAKIVLVDDSEESLQKTDPKSGHTTASSAGAHVGGSGGTSARTLNPDPDIAADRPAKSVMQKDTTAMAATQAAVSPSRSNKRIKLDAGDSARLSLDTPQIAADSTQSDPVPGTSTGKRSALSYLNPLNLLRRGQVSQPQQSIATARNGEAVDVKVEIKVKEDELEVKPVPDEDQLYRARQPSKKRHRTDTAAGYPSSASASATVSVKWSRTSVSRDGPPILAPDLRAESKSPRFKAERGSHAADLYRSRDAAIIKRERSPNVKVECQPKPKLRGFRPDLGIVDGLTWEWVAQKGEEARAFRAARARI